MIYFITRIRNTVLLLTGKGRTIRRLYLGLIFLLPLNVIGHTINYVLEKEKVSNVIGFMGSWALSTSSPLARTIYFCN